MWQWKKKTKMHLGELRESHRGAIGKFFNSNISALMNLDELIAKKTQVEDFMHEKLLDEIDDYSITNDFTSWNVRRYY